VCCNVGIRFLFKQIFVNCHSSRQIGPGQRSHTVSSLCVDDSAFTAFLLNMLQIPPENGATQRLLLWGFEKHLGMLKESTRAGDNHAFDGILLPADGVRRRQKYCHQNQQESAAVPIWMNRRLPGRFAEQHFAPFDICVPEDPFLLVFTCRDLGRQRYQTFFLCQVLS